MKTSEQLKLMKSYVDTPEKWFKGGPFDKTNLNCVCLWKAKIKVDSCIWNNSNLDRIVLQEIKLLTGKHWECIPHFNDHPNTTHDMIMQVMDNAIFRAELEYD